MFTITRPIAAIVVVGLSLPLLTACFALESSKSDSVGVRSINGQIEFLICNDFAVEKTVLSQKNPSRELNWEPFFESEASFTIGRGETIALSDPVFEAAMKSSPWLTEGDRIELLLVGNAGGGKTTIAADFTVGPKGLPAEEWQAPSDGGLGPLCD